MKRPRSNIARNRATKDRFAGIRARIVSQLLEKLLCVELPHRTADRSSEARSPGQRSNKWHGFAASLSYGRHTINSVFIYHTQSHPCLPSRISRQSLAYYSPLTPCAILTVCQNSQVRLRESSRRRGFPRSRTRESSALTGDASPVALPPWRRGGRAHNGDERTGACHRAPPRLGRGTGAQRSQNLTGFALRPDAR